MTITEAVRELRRMSGQSQQHFGTQLNISIRALQQYEQGKVPEARQLLAFAAHAYTVGRKDLYQIFTKSLNEELAPPPGFYLLVQFGAVEKSPVRRKK
jgi:transcriptional regulator with XRE-family HTH domain